MRVLRGRIAQSVVDEFVEAQIDTPVELRRGLAMRIWGVELDTRAHHAMEGNNTARTVDLAVSTVQGETTIPRWDNTGVIGLLTTLTDENIATNTGGFAGLPQVSQNYLPSGLLCASEKLSLYLDSNASVDNFLATVLIKYDLVEVGERFIYMLQRTTSKIEGD